jgi:glycosyltransferase involved in cell wall biosynthesis
MKIIKHIKDAKQMDSVKLSILIPSTHSRMDMTMKLTDRLLDQIEFNDSVGVVEVVTLWDDGAKSIGTKRNELIQMAKGDYVCFVDSDDDISSDYVERLMEGINLGVDCCSLKGCITWDGKNPEIFEHSLRYSEYKTTENPIKYERFPNHLNCIKKSLVFDIKYPEISHGEDTDWATQVFKAGVLKTEHYIDSVIYHYKFITNK